MKKSLQVSLWIFHEADTETILDMQIYRVKRVKHREDREREEEAESF